MFSFRKNGVLGAVALAFGLIAGCTVPTREKLACEDVGTRRVEDACSVAISDIATMNACTMAFGPGYELRVCEPGSGLGCEELTSFGTDVICVGVAVMCCPVEP